MLRAGRGAGPCAREMRPGCGPPLGLGAGGGRWLRAAAPPHARGPAASGSEWRVAGPGQSRGALATGCFWSRLLGSWVWHGF